MKKVKSIGNSEMKILNYISSATSRSVKEVAEHFAAEDLARTTILTVMERLRTKGFLTRRKKDGIYHYYAKIPQSELLQTLVKDFVSKTLGGKITPFLMYLHGNESDMSSDDIAELQKIVERQQQMDVEE